MRSRTARRPWRLSTPCQVRAGVSWLCWLWLVMMLATQAQIAAMEGAVGQVAHMAFPGASSKIAQASSFLGESWKPFLLSHPEHFWAALTTLAAVLLLLSGGYRRLEKITTFLVAAVTLFTVASVLVLQWTRFRITAADIGHGFDLDVPPAAVILAFSAFGITGVGAVRALRLPLLVHREGLRRALPACEPMTNPGPIAHEAGPASCSLTHGSA